SDILTFDPETGATANLTADVTGPIHALPPLIWSPDGTRLLYSSPIPTGENALQAAPFVMNADGTGKHPLVTAITRQWTPVCWMSPDLVVVQGTSTPPPVGDFYVVDADGSGLRPLTTAGKETASVGICSPASRRFFFSRDGDLTHHWVPLAGGP